MSSKTALITGDSSGIGLELARIHASRKGDLVLVARRESRLNEIKGELEREHGVRVSVLACDLANPDTAAYVHREITTNGTAVDYLINNAGFGGHGNFHERDWARDRAMIDLNVTALAALTRLFLPEMVQRGSGRIMQVGSLAGFIPGPRQAVYYATKAFVLSFSEALASELEGSGVTVTVLCPGPTATEFAREADVEDVTGFRRPASARVVARCGYDAMLRGRVIAVPGFSNRIIVHGLLRLMPRAMITRISRSRMAKKEATERLSD